MIPTKVDFFREDTTPDGMGGFTGALQPTFTTFASVQHGKTQFAGRDGVGMESVVDMMIFLLSGVEAEDVQIGDTVEVPSKDFSGTVTQKDMLDGSIGVVENG